MKKTMFILCYVLFLCGVILLIENMSKKELLKRGVITEGSADLSAPYGRRVAQAALYEENTPNFSYGAFNEKGVYTHLETDSNGFLSDVPIYEKKQPGTVRIFFTGGSAAFGSGQNRESCGDSSYPRGTMDYQTSIPGQIKKMLAKKYPNVRFEVVNAAVVKRKFHQSMQMYFEKLHQFDPDLIINFDGFNDGVSLFGIVGEDPFLTVTQQTREAFEVEMLSRLPQKPYSLFLLNYLTMRREQEDTGGDISCDEKDLRGIKDSVIPFEIPAEKMEAFKTLVQKTDRKILWMIASYEEQLKQDGVASIFCLQPTLQRELGQKQLSDREKRMYDFMYKGNDLTLKKKACLLSMLPMLEKELPEIRTAHERLGIDVLCHTDRMTNGYGPAFIAPVIDSIVRDHGGAFVDIGSRITRLDRLFEFFTDYCHLTAKANTYVAEMLVPEIEKKLPLRK